MASTTSAITVNGLYKSYGKHAVLTNLCFEIKQGSIFALLGENGAGKTTTVRILSTLLRADKGQVKVAGYELSSEAVSIRKVISVTGQFAAVDDLLTGEENLQLIGRLNHLSKASIQKRTSQLLEQFALNDAAKRQVKTYSGGMRRKLDIAISLIASPQIIFLDEPTTGLDPRSRQNMWQIIRGLANSGITIFLTTQYLEEADQLADKIAVLAKGEIVAEGNAEELKQLVGKEKTILNFPCLTKAKKAEVLLNGQLNPKELSVTITTDSSPEKLRQTLNFLHEQALDPNGIEFRKPTLDDVFMKITATKGGI